MNQQEKCSQCLQHFSLINPPRSMPLCEHNICTKCLKEAIQHRQQFIECGFCTRKIKKRDIKLFPKNLKLIQKIKANNSTCSGPKQQKSICNSSMTAKSQLPIKQEEELLIASDVSFVHDHEQETMCEVHKKSLDIICATEKRRICPHCAIFGNHKDHKFKTLVEFQTEVKEKTLRFLDITKKKQDAWSAYNLTNLKQTFNAKIDERKTLLSNEITKHFQGLIKMIRKAEQSIERELQQKFLMVRTRISQNLSGQFKLKQSYISWQNNCQEIVDRLKVASRTKDRIQTYYQSQLQICQQGEFFLDQMVNNLTELYKENDQHIKDISLKIQEKTLDNCVSLICPILDESNLGKELDNIQSSFFKDFPSKNLLPTRQDLEENSFLFEQQVSAIQPKLPSTQKHQHKHATNKLNKSYTSINSITNLSAFMTISPKNRSKNQEKNRSKEIFNKSRTSMPRRFGSPDFSKPNKPKQFRTPQQILISLASNDLINEIDLSQMQLSNHDIVQFLQRAHKIRQLKAIKLQKNNLTDDGFESICKYLEHVSNLNLSFNFLTDKCLDILIKNKEYFYKMRIINLSNNKVTSDKTDIKIKPKLDEIKRLGIVISM